MNFTTKNFIKFLIACIGLTLCFSLLFQRIYLGIPLGLFLAVCLCYDPKRYNAAKKKYEENSSSKANENL